MRRPMMTALAVLLFGTILLPGCFYVGPYGWWWYPDHDEGGRHHREWRERHGALTAPPDEQGRRGNHARLAHDNDSAG